MKTYNVKYEIELTNDKIIHSKEINVKNCENGVHAQIKLEGYLKKKYSNFKKMVVHSCNEDVMSAFNEMFGNIMSGDGNPTAGGFPFGSN